MVVRGCSSRVDVGGCVRSHQQPPDLNHVIVAGGTFYLELKFVGFVVVPITKGDVISGD